MTLEQRIVNLQERFAKFNENHDEQGRFSSGEGGGSSKPSGGPKPTPQLGGRKGPGGQGGATASVKVHEQLTSLGFKQRGDGTYVRNNTANFRDHDHLTIGHDGTFHVSDPDGKGYTTFNSIGALRSDIKASDRISREDHAAGG